MTTTPEEETMESFIAFQGRWAAFFTGLGYTSAAVQRSIDLPLWWDAFDANREPPVAPADARDL